MPCNHSTPEKEQLKESINMTSIPMMRVCKLLITTLCDTEKISHKDMRNASQDHHNGKRFLCMLVRMHVWCPYCVPEWDLQ